MQHVNPYNYNLPVDAPMFFGRQHVVDELVNILTAIPGDSIALVGGRRMGKTSVLEAIKRQINQPNPQHGSILIALLIDISGEMISSAESFFSCMYRSILDAVQIRLHGLHLLGDDFDLAKAPLPQLRGLLTRLELIVMQELGLRLRIVVLFDECEAIVNQGWDTIIHAILRTLLSHEATRSILKIVMAGSQRFLSHVRRKDTSPLWNVLTYHMLESLSYADSKLLIDEPTHQMVSEGDTDTIIRISGRHPFIIQFFMHKLWNKQQLLVAGAHIDSIIKMFYRERDDFHTWLHDIAHSDRIPELIMITKVAIKKDRIFQQLTQDRLLMERLIEALCYHGIMIYDPRTSECHALNTLFNSWLGYHRESNSLHADPVQEAGIGLVENVVSPALDDNDTVSLLPLGGSSMNEVEAFAVAAATKGLDVLFDEVRFLLKEIRDRRKEDDPGSISTRDEAAPPETTKDAVSARGIKQLRLHDDPQEVAFLLNQLEIFRMSRRHHLDIKHKMGILTPLYVVHELKAAEDNILEYSQKLKVFIERVYGHSIVLVGLS